MDRYVRIESWLEEEQYCDTLPITYVPAYLCTYIALQHILEWIELGKYLLLGVFKNCIFLEKGKYFRNWQSQSKVVPLGSLGSNHLETKLVEMKLPNS